MLRTLSTRTYDAADRKVADQDVYSSSSQYQYDPSGNLIAVIDPYQHTAKYEYDAMNRRTAVIDANGNRATTTYNLAGRVKTVTNANGETVTNTYDALGRLTQVTDPLGYITQLSYDPNSNLTCSIDPNAQAGLQPKNADNCTESRVYDELNRVTQIKDALNGVTVKTYDLLSNVTSLKDATNKTTSFAFDDLGRQISTTDPLSKTTVFARDQAGNAYQVTNRLGQITRITFDNLNRPTNYSYLTDDTSETISYDSFGNKSGASNATVSYTFQYDAKNRLLSKTDARSNKALGFTYDAVDNMLSKTDYQGQTTDFQYDSANRLVSMSNKAYLKAIYQFDPAGRLLSRVLSDGAKNVYGYNADGQLISLLMQSASGSTMSNLTYTRDRVGNALTQNGQQAPSSTDNRTYTYDALYRLTQVSASAGSELFSYDAVGNRQTYNDGTTHAYEYFANSNRLKAIHTSTLSSAIEKSFTYDDEGRRLTQSGGSNYATSIGWDQKNRAINMTSSGNGATTFQYDPMDYRIKRTGGSLGARDYYLEGEHLEAEYSNGVIQSKYLRGVSTDELVAGFTYNNGQATPGIYHHDQITSVTAVSNHDGSTQQALTYGAFGNLKTTSGSTTNRLRYTGRELDLDTNLYYYRARYYDPGTGFISEDPKGFSAGINFYAYANNNPINANDPSGMDLAIDPWLWANIGLGSASLAHNISSGNYGWAAVDAAGLTYDAAAGLVPFLPAGASAGLKAWRAGNTLANSITIGSDVAKVADIANDAAKAADTSMSALAAGRAIHNEVGTALDEGNVLSSSANNYFKGANGATGRQADLSWGNTAGGTGGLGVWADLTTPGQWASHVSTYSANLGEGVPLLYQSGVGIVDTGTSITQLYSGASSALTGGQYLFSGNGAAGGFLLYPNKPNNNSIQSVYSK